MTEAIKPNAKFTEKDLTSRQFLVGPDLDLSEDFEFIPVAGEQKHLIITIHGIGTMGDWMDEFSESNPLKEVIKIEKIPIKWVDIYTFLFGSYEDRILSVEEAIKHLISSNEDKNISVICHSFGSKLFCDAIKNINYKFYHVYFIGGVAKKTDISSIINKISCFVNDCGERDYWPLVASFLRPRRYEAIGYYGAHPYGISRDFNSNHYEYASSSHINMYIVPNILNNVLGAYKPKYRFIRNIKTIILNRKIIFGYTFCIISLISLIIYNVFF